MRRTSPGASERSAGPAYYLAFARFGGVGRSCSGSTDRSTFRPRSRSDDIRYVCHPQSVNGYAKTLAAQRAAAADTALGIDIGRARPGMPSRHPGIWTRGLQSNRAGMAAHCEVDHAVRAARRRWRKPMSPVPFGPIWNRRRSNPTWLAVPVDSGTATHGSACKVSSESQTAGPRIHTRERNSYENADEPPPARRCPRLQRSEGLQATFTRH
jgi:hypothetical protein